MQPAPLQDFLNTHGYSFLAGFRGPNAVGDEVVSGQVLAGQMGEGQLLCILRLTRLRGRNGFVDRHCGAKVSHRSDERSSG